MKTEMINNKYGDDLRRALKRALRDIINTIPKDDRDLAAQMLVGILIQQAAEMTFIKTCDMEAFIQLSVLNAEQIKKAIEGE